MAGEANFYSVVDLERLTQAAKGAPEDLLLRAELLSNSRVEGSTIVNLARTEWLDRWRAYRQQHPEFHPLGEPAIP